MNCAQCNKGFSCGCQKTKAADSKTVHKTCLTAYNNKINVKSDPLTEKLNIAKLNLTR
jgi:hypothetical protein